MSENILPKKKMPCGWRRRKRWRPDEILAAAAKTADERGTKAMRMADVARNAGITPGTIYLYFSGKADLVAALQRKRAILPC